MLAMIKPQFEVGPGRVGKGGVVRDADERRSALVAVGEVAVALGEVVLGYHSSGLPGPKGNRETFVHLAAQSGARRGGRTTAELQTLARTVEPA
jgi:23S rRNA (cytidine1920-2'-O)/16S rRNA (cytidine1409-2'-O)-methyltransferase